MKAALLVVTLLGCTKPNPNRCCVDEADCASNGLPIDSTCEAGLLCRGNQCIAQPCESASECDATAPYCLEGFCSEACASDMQCPGYEQAGTFCVSGSCAACRDDADCATALPVCDNGSCRACATHAECSSGVCSDAGACVAESEIAYVDPTGAPTAECSRSAPCSSVSHALTRPQSYVLIASGTYTSSSTLDVTGMRYLIGSGATRPILRRSSPGPIVTFSSGELLLEYLQIDGATTDTESGDGISCFAAGGAPNLRLRRAVVSNNDLVGLRTLSCTVEATESEFVRNGTTSGRNGASLSNSTGTFDRCLVVENGSGLDLDGGLYRVTNSIIARNASASTSAYGINLYTTEPGTRIEFNTIVDNVGATGSGFSCNLQGFTASFPNNIIARNRAQTSGTSCSYPSSIIIDSDITSLNFVSPDSPPYDYHIQAGSLAVDAATTSAVAHDFDGDPRPQGAGRDVGADELSP